ncbi:MAG: hypothetical protein K2M99_08675, partial [Treponemataceae bacterium]|nr:hypothetical protein [Treponemataceae bacterium]
WLGFTQNWVSMVLLFSLQLEECFSIFSKTRLILLPFPLETSTAFHCETAFSAPPESEDSLVVEK